VPEVDRAVAGTVLVEGDALVGMIEKLRQDALALLDRRAPEVFAVEFEEVERAEHGGGIMTLLRADDDHRSVGLPATPPE
jgi:hypothetical protein